MSDAFQDLLFGSLSQPVEDTLADRELAVCALNVQGPAVGRAERLADWLTRTGSNALILTELHPSDGGRRLIANLRATGYQTVLPPGWRDARHFCALAVKGFAEVAPTSLPDFDSRVAAATLSSAAGQIQLVGVYGPTNGMTDDSSIRRAAFQRQFLEWLRQNMAGRIIVGGDLNIIEPGHRPPLPHFRDHDYAFYQDLIRLGLRDAYRFAQPEGTDHSWSNPIHGAQRLDHILVSAGTGHLASCAYDHSTRSDALTDHSAILARIDTRN
ncbi:endonuclease/exonuclease/phosphatase family protein [Catellatospora methionotrophica]|uniref:endonuclease/exonuclease/phosphatase family protein n=1 Tax=Catellatospora methionotrophica TaxID=121620 RepID=UPI0033FE9AF8